MKQLMNVPKRPIFYKRFTDDGFGLWVGSKEELLEFVRYANKIHDNIKIELRYSNPKIEFPDTIVKIENGHIYTDLYVKPTEKQLYLNHKSCHPPSTKKGLAYRLRLRLKRICEKEEDYNKQRKVLKQKLRKRGFSGKTIESQLEKVDILDRDKLLKENGHKIKSKRIKRVPLVLTYSHLLLNIHRIVSKHTRLLHESENMRQVFQELPIVAFRGDRNLSDTLVHSKTNPAIRNDQDNCKSNCKMCEIISASQIVGCNSGRTYSVPSNVNCKEKNVVYAISCRLCESVVYVGETETQLHERMREHIRDVRLKRDEPINYHFS